jgi:hypothetical protein
MMPDFLIDTLAGLSVPEALCLATGLFSGSLVPFFLLVDADYEAAWRWLTAAAGAVWLPVRNAALDVAALFILLATSPKGAMA